MAGALGATLIAGKLVETTGTRPAMAIGIPLLAAFGAGVAIAGNLAMLFAFLILNGAAFSLTNVAMNLEADRVEQATGRRVMNRCHGFWSLGMLAVSLVGVGARAVPVSAPLHLTALVLPVTLVTVLAIRSMRVAPKPATDTAPAVGLARPSRRTGLLVLFSLSAGVSQLGIQNWSVIFMRDTFFAPDWVDTLSLPVYLLAMALGRIFTDGWITRFGPARVALTLALVAVAGNVTVVFTPSLEIALVGFALIGAGTGAFFPMAVTAAARTKNRPASQSVAAYILLSGVVMTVVPISIGAIADAFGLRASFALFLPPLVVTLLLVRVVSPGR